MVRPGDGRLFIVTKGTTGGIYRAPETLRTDRVNVLTRLRSTPDWITAGDFTHDDSGRFAIRTAGDKIYVYDRIWARHPTTLSSPSELKAVRQARRSTWP